MFRESFEVIFDLRPPPRSDCQPFKREVNGFWIPHLGVARGLFLKRRSMTTLVQLPPTSVINILLNIQVGVAS